MKNVFHIAAFIAVILFIVAAVVLLKDSNFLKGSKHEVIVPASHLHDYAYVLECSQEVGDPISSVYALWGGQKVYQVRNWEYPPKIFDKYVDVDYVQDPYINPYHKTIVWGKQYEGDSDKTIFQVRPLYRTEFHPTGDYLAKLNDNGKLEKIELPIINSDPDSYRYWNILGWTKNGEVLLTQTEPNNASHGLWKYNWESDKMNAVIPESSTISNLQFSADGKIISVGIEGYYDGMRVNKEVIFVDLESNSIKSTLSCDDGVWILSHGWLVNPSDRSASIDSGNQQSKLQILEDKEYESILPYFSIIDGTPNTVTLKVHDDVIFNELKRSQFDFCIISASAGGFEEGRAPSCGPLEMDGKPIPFIKNVKERTIRIGDPVDDVNFDIQNDTGFFRVGCASCTTNLWIKDFPVIDPTTGKRIKREFYGVIVW